MLITGLRFRSILFLLSTFIAGAVAQGQITPSQDAYTNSATPTTNFGTAVTLGAVSSASSIQTTYIQFDLSSVPSGYSGANVAKATLKLYVNAVTTAGSFNIDFVDGSWTEKTITASLAPALGTTIESSVGLTGAKSHDYVLVDVTTAVQAWLNGTQANDGIALVANSPLSASFDSKENTAQSHAAELDIVFSGNGTITGVTTAMGGGLTGGGTTGTLKLGLTTGCGANQVLQWNGSAWACATAGTGTVSSVGSGAGLTGGPITGNGTLSIATGGVTNPMLANPSLTVNAGTGLTGGGVVTLGGATTLNVDMTKIPSLTASNGFSAPQTVTESSQLVAISAVQTASTGQTFGVEGITSSRTSGAAGILGIAGASSGSAYGVMGQTNSVAGYGVYGSAPGGGFGVYSAANMGNYGDLRQDYSGINSGSVSPGIRFGSGGTGEGISSNRTGAANQNGIDLYTNFTPRLSVTNGGPIGIGTTSPLGQLEVDALTHVNAIIAYGYSSNNGSGEGGASGVEGDGGYGDQLNASFGGVGVVATGGVGFASGGYGGDGPGGSFGGGNNGVNGGGTGDGILVAAGSGYAGAFTGNVSIAGTLSKSGGSFKIDHPLDPANKYLYHSFVESPDMMNVYNGNVTLEGNGEAVVELPDWFEALNKDFRYQLTCIGGFAPVYVADEIQNNRFRIAGGRPGVKVSWQVTGIRQDPWANAHRIPVEEEKNARERGFYIHPELYGAADEKQMEWARHPEVMRRMKQAARRHAVQQAKPGNSTTSQVNTKEAQ